MLGKVKVKKAEGMRRKAEVFWLLAIGILFFKLNLCASAGKYCSLFFVSLRRHERHGGCCLLVATG
jgi:hypothetical protein